MFNLFNIQSIIRNIISFNFLNKRIIITKDEFKKHNTVNSVWIRVDDKVYDITDYISSHPGGPNIILKYQCSDISYHAKFHSNKIFKILKPRFIGYIES